MQVGTTKVGGIGSVAQAVVQGLDVIGDAVGEVQTAAAALARYAEQNRDVVGTGRSHRVGLARGR